MSRHNGPHFGKLILIPALTTLGISLLHLGAELMDFPSLLASKQAGGPGAPIGISWLPPIFGVYLAFKLYGTLGRL